MRKGKGERQVLEVAAEAQRRIVEQLARMTPAQIAGTGFDQVGLTDGVATVEELVRHGELGLAVEHVLYMLVETGTPLTAASAQALGEVAAALGRPRCLPPRSRIT